MLSVVILTFNSEKYLAEALKSCEFADEVVVVDSGSTDGTEQICADFKNVKFYKEKWRGFSAQKQLGTDLARNRWVFVLDSDEVILKPLRDEILRVLERPEFCAYEVARANLFFGKEVRTMGLFPDYTIRLFDKTKAQFDGREIHEKVVLKSAARSQSQNLDGGAGALTASEAVNSEQNGAEGEICAENCAENVVNLQGSAQRGKQAEFDATDEVQNLAQTTKCDDNSKNGTISHDEMQNNASDLRVKFDAPNETQNLIQNHANVAKATSLVQTEAQNGAQTPNLALTEAQTKAQNDTQTINLAASKARIQADFQPQTAAKTANLTANKTQNLTKNSGYARNAQNAAVSQAGEQSDLQDKFNSLNETQNLADSDANTAQTTSSAPTEAQNDAQTPNLTASEAQTPNPAPKNEIGRLKNHFKHYAYDSIEQFIAKQNRYSSLGAKGAKTSKFKAVLNPAWTFFKLFFIKGGWREGWRGYVIARLYAQYTFWKYVK